MLLISVIILSFLLSTAVRFMFERSLLEQFPLFGEQVSLRLQENAGIAFGMDLPLTAFLPLVVIALSLLSITAYKHRRKALPAASFGLILGGALANLFDRLDDGMVTDFFSVFSFPVFNIADSAITIGVAALLASFFLSTREGSKGRGSSGTSVSG